MADKEQCGAKVYPTGYTIISCNNRALALGLATSFGVYLLVVAVIGSAQIENALGIDSEGVFFVIVLSTLLLSYTRTIGLQ